MSESKVYPVKAHIGSDALLDKEGYEAMYLASVQNPDAFWGEHAATRSPSSGKGTTRPRIAS